MVTTQIIEVRTNNLFANGYLQEFPQDGEGSLMRNKYVFVGGPGDRYHSYVQGDKLYLLASRYYGGQLDDASKYWGIIADANNIHNPFDLDMFLGKTLLIPDVQLVKLLN